MKSQCAIDACWQDLADAIIFQAATDYRRNMKMLRENNQNTRLLIGQQCLEVFFRSDWFQQLTNLDGRRFLIDLQKEAAQ
jgi:hypothetical protein